MIVKCEICGTSDGMLHRTKPIGQPDAGWTCMGCIEVNEPELANNIKSEPDFDVVKDIERIITSNP